MELVAALIAIGVLLLAALAVVGLYVSRQSTLSRRVGSFGCYLRRPTSAGSWSAGRAQYATGRLLWWRTFSLSPRPAYSWYRSELVLGERTPLDVVDDGGRPMLLVSCTHRDEHFELTLSVGAHAGLVSWLESGPRPVGRVV